MPSLVSGSPSGKAGLSRTPSISNVLWLQRVLPCLLEKTFPWSDWEICSETAPPAGHSGNDAHPFSGDPRIPELSGVKMYPLSLTLHLEHFIKSSQEIVLDRCYCVPIL